MCFLNIKKDIHILHIMLEGHQCANHLGKQKTPLHILEPALRSMFGIVIRNA